MALTGEAKKEYNRKAAAKKQILIDAGRKALDAEKAGTTEPETKEPETNTGAFNLKKEADAMKKEEEEEEEKIEFECGSCGAALVSKVSFCPHCGCEF